MDQSSEPATDCHSPSSWGVYVVAALVVFVPLFVVLFPLLAFLSDPFGSDDAPAVSTPSEGFSQLTGWQLPDNAIIVKNVNSHSGFKNDGDFILIVKLSESQLQTLLENDSNTWLKCPVDPETAVSTGAFPDHSGTIYYAKKTLGSDTDWHRGHVVIVNPETGMVWIYEWKI